MTSCSPANFEQDPCRRCGEHQKTVTAAGAAANSPEYWESQGHLTPEITRHYQQEGVPGERIDSIATFLEMVRVHQAGLFGTEELQERQTAEAACSGPADDRNCPVYNVPAFPDPALIRAHNMRTYEELQARHAEQEQGTDGVVINLFGNNPPTGV